MTKPRLNLIAAQSRNRVIGRHNTMPWHLPRDLQWFKQHTQGHPVIMGKNTYHSIGKALPQRRNIVLSKDNPAHYPDAEVMTTLEQALAATQNAEQVFIIGGAQLYASSIHLADTLIITHIDTDINDGESYFPEIDRKIWQLTSKSDHPADADNAYNLSFCIYQRKP